VQKRKYFNSLIKNDGNGRKLAVIIPFRDRFEELLEFVPHMEDFLNNQDIPHHFFVINQIDRFRFNRASLINVGYLYARDNFDYIAMHDVDLLPLNSHLKYEYPESGPLHIAAPGLHPKYNYPNFIGGILLIKNDHFELVNGLSNKYWGWGLEDDEFFVRLKDAGLKVHRPSDIETNMSNTFMHIHDREHRRRDTAKCFNQREETRKRDKKTGLNTIKYNISSRKELAVDGIKLTILNVKLECDRNFTPWCECPKVDNKVKAKS
jgi:xylosylprotein 4-beta-galactosyltransferase